jgi:hypothetical protein
MKARVIGVVLVVSGLFGAVATTAPATSQLASRRGSHHHGHHDHRRVGDNCAAKKVLVGPVCVTVNHVLSDILHA